MTRVLIGLEKLQSNPDRESPVTIHSNYDDQQRQIEREVVYGFHAILSGESGWKCDDSMNTSLNMDFSESVADKPLEFGDDGGRIDHWALTPHVHAWIYSDQAGRSYSYLVADPTSTGVPIRTQLVNLIQEVEAGNVVQSPRTAGPADRPTPSVPIHIWCDSSRDLGETDVEFSPVHLSTLPHGVYVENTRGGRNGGSFFAGPFPDVEKAMSYWHDTGIYDEEKLYVHGEGYTAS